jgi:replication factor A1
LQEYKEHDDPRFAWTFNKHMFKPYNMRIRAKVETWQDEARVKCNIQEIEPLDWKKGSDELLALIREFRV